MTGTTPGAGEVGTGEVCVNKPTMPPIDSRTYTIVMKEKVRLLEFLPLQDGCVYLHSALPLLRKGFVVWSLNPNNPKAGSLGWNSLAYDADETFHRRIAQERPDSNACVVSCRGVGNPLMLDIDDASVEPAIREAGNLPDTYTVGSDYTKPFKKHLYFTQTEYSVRMLKGEMNGLLRDATRLVQKVKKGKSRMVHPNLLDVKGCGGGGIVVAAGSVFPPDEEHPGGKKYTCVSEKGLDEIAPIPDWLVDWILSTRATYVSALEQERNERIQNGETVLIPYEEIRNFLFSRSCSLAGCGVGVELREKCLIEQCLRDCEDGADFVKDSTDQIHLLARAPKKLGKPPIFSTNNALRSPAAPLSAKGSIVTAKPTRFGVLATAVQQFPEHLLVTDGWALLQDACIEAGFELRQDESGKKTVRRLLKGKYQRNGKFWKRLSINNTITHRVPNPAEVRKSLILTNQSVANVDSNQVVNRKTML
jgi:hypothetical protein